MAMDETARTVFIRTEEVTLEQPPKAHLVHCPPVAEPAWAYSCSYMAIGTGVSGHTGAVSYDGGTPTTGIRLPGWRRKLNFGKQIFLRAG